MGLRWVALGLALPLVAMPGQAAADWLQSGYDAARTGNVLEPGPAWDDVVFRLQLPPATFVSEPLMADGAAFVLTGGADGTSQLVRVDLQTGAHETIQDLDFVGSFMAADEEAFYILGRDGVVAAVPRSEGAARWQVELDPTRPLRPVNLPPDTAPVTVCSDSAPVLRANILVVACYQGGGESTQVWALDREDGAVVWTWVREASPLLPRLPPTDPPPNPADYVFGEISRYLEGSPPVGGFWWNRPMGLSLVGSQVMVSVFVQYAPDTEGARMVRTDISALEMDGGQLQWIKSFGGPDSFSEITGQGFPNFPAAATGNTERVFLELGYVFAVEADKDAPYEIGYVPIRPAGRLREGDAGSGFALRDETLFASSRSSLHRIGPDLQIEWSYPDPSTAANLEWGLGGLVIADDVLYARAGPLQDVLFNPDGTLDRSHALLYAVDANSGQPLWVHRFAVDFRFAVSQGLLVAWEPESGSLTVLGRSEASISPKATVSSDYPDPGEIVLVDLSATGAGQLGPATEFRADWGDGENTDWQGTPVFEHRYATFIDAQARFYARNEAGQSASIPYTFYVGRAENLNFLQAQFGEENQDRTFFLLGLVLTAIGALIGLIAVRRRRSRVRRELEAIEAVYAETHERPNECEAALLERGSHARGLLADHKIDEGGASVLIGRIEELRRSLRMGVLDERLGFLPLAMVKTLQGMLEDGRISEWEHSHFVEALEKDDLLTREQKGKVRRLIDEWFERDVPGVERPSASGSG